MCAIAEMHMTDNVAERGQLQHIAELWLSLWCAPPDMDIFEALHAPDFEDCSSAGRPKSKDAFRAALVEMCTAFPDLKTKVDDLVIDEEQQTVAVRWSSVGTNRGPFLGKAASGLPIRITGIEIIKIRDGKIFKRWGEWDISDFLAFTT